MCYKMLVSLENREDNRGYHENGLELKEVVTSRIPFWDFHLFFTLRVNYPGKPLSNSLSKKLGQIVTHFCLTFRLKFINLVAGE